METPFSKIKFIHPLMYLSALLQLLHVHGVSSFPFHFYLDIERHIVPTFGNYSV
jgi:hypothetical protein